MLGQAQVQLQAVVALSSIGRLVAAQVGTSLGIIAQNEEKAQHQPDAHALQQIGEQYGHDGNDEGRELRPAQLPLLAVERRRGELVAHQQQHRRQRRERDQIQHRAQKQ